MNTDEYASDWAEGWKKVFVYTDTVDQSHLDGLEDYRYDARTGNISEVKEYVAYLTDLKNVIDTIDSFLTGKYRCQSAFVAAIFDTNWQGSTVNVAYSWFDPSFEYRVGNRVSIKQFDWSRRCCASGIHVFRTYEEARNWPSS